MPTNGEIKITLSNIYNALALNNVTVQLRYLKVWLNDYVCGRQLQVTLASGFYQDNVGSTNSATWTDVGTPNRPPAITIKIPPTQQSPLASPLAASTVAAISIFPTATASGVILPLVTIRYGIKFKLA